MNFLVSKNPVLIDHYWAPLLENGESQLLGDFPELLWRAASAKEGLALIDTQIPGFSGMAEVAQLKRTSQNIRILLLSGTMQAEEELAALAAGAAGSCGPNLLPEKIRQILATVNDGGVWISSAALPQLLQRLKRWENTAKQKNRLVNPNWPLYFYTLGYESGRSPRPRCKMPICCREGKHCMANVRGCDLPDDLYYHVDSNVWARLESDGSITVGMTSYACSLAGQLVAATPSSSFSNLATLC